jgi:chaperone required for assembly of F1-ATPase
MRDILEDAHEHRDDGYGRAQAAEKKVLPKRFYKEVGHKKAEGGFEIILDGRAVKTPSKKSIIVPNVELADILVGEWGVQKEFIEANSMPFTRLINSALEGKAGIEEELAKEIINYVGNDLLLYRADSPKELVSEQERYWDSILFSLAKEFDVKFMPVVGIIHAEQPQASLQKLALILEGKCKVFLTAMMSITGLSGSGLLAIALHQKLIGADEAWISAHVDEDFTNRVWGKDIEAEKRRSKRRVEFDAAVRVVELLS